MKIPLSIKFFSRVEQQEGGCWIWEGNKYPNGYGQTYLEGKQHGAHRVSWLLFHCGIPSGMYVLHKCDNPPCVNPDHLFLGTAKDNMDDMVKKGRNRYKWTFGEGHCKSVLTEKDVLEMRSLCKKGVPRFEIAKQLGVHYSTTAHAIRGLTWKHLPGAIQSAPKS